MRRTTLAAAFVALAVIVGACVSTQLTNTWANPAYIGRLPKKVLVVAAIPAESVRRQVEQAEANRLMQRGIQAVPSYTVLPKQPDGTQVRQVVAENGFDGVLLSRYKGTQQKINQTGPSYWGGPYYGYGPYSSRYYGGYYPGETYTTEEHQMETSLFDTSGGGQLIWSGTSKTFASGSGQEDVQHYVVTVINKMEKDLTGRAA